jgi:hypothetical protein
MATHANIGRVYFNSDKSPAGPLQVAVGNFPTSGVKNILINNVGESAVFARGRANTTATSPDIVLHPGHTGMIVLVGTAGQPAYIEVWKRYDPRYINMHRINEPIMEHSGVIEIEAIQG